MADTIIRTPKGVTPDGVEAAMKATVREREATTGTREPPHHGDVDSGPVQP